MSITNKYTATAETLVEGSINQHDRVDVNNNKMVSFSSAAVDEAVMPATPSILPVGGEYRATPTTYTDGDATIIQSDANGNLKSTLATALSKTIDSITNYPAPWNYTIVDLATDADTTVTAVPAILGGFKIDTAMSAHVALIKDGAATVITLPASSAVNFREDYGGGILMATNITIESDNSGTGKVGVFWRNITN